MENRIPKSTGQEIDQHQGAIVDDVSNDYLKRREAFGVINSPAFKALEHKTDDNVDEEEKQPSAADMYLEEKFPTDPVHSPMFPGGDEQPISAVTGEPEPNMETEIEGRNRLWVEVGKPLLKGIFGIDFDTDHEKFEAWVNEFTETNGRKPEILEIPEEIWNLAEFDMAELPLDAPRKIAQGGIKEAIQHAAKKADDALGFSDKPIFEILQRPGVVDDFAMGAAEDAPYHRFAGNINFGHINSTDDAKSLIDQVATMYADDIGEARRNVVTWDETKELAELSGMTPAKLLARRKGESFNAHEALAARQILVSSAETLSDLAQKVATGTADTIDKFAFRKQLAVHYALQSQVSGMTAEAGRSLNAFKIDAASNPGKIKAINELMDSAGGFNTDTLAEMISDLDNPEAIGKFTRTAVNANSFDMLTEAWINALLSGPQTHSVNMLSNALTGFWMVPERIIGSAISKSPIGSGDIGAYEALHQAYGMIEGFKDGLKAFGKTIKTGDPADVVGKLETRYPKAITAENVRKTMIGSQFGRHLDEGSHLARAVDLMGETVRMPGRFLQAEDSFFKSVGYRMELRARAFRQARMEGLEGDAAAQRIRDILTDPEAHAPDIHLDAIDMSRYQTFTNELGKAGQSLQKAINAMPALRFIVPFVRTPSNILKFAFERTPLAPLSKQVRADIIAGGARRDLALAKITMGSMVMAIAGAMAADGRITGGGPSNRKMRALMRNKGWQPYSFKIGDTYYAYGRLEPIGMLLGLAADAQQIMSESDDLTAGKIAAAVSMAVSKNMTSKTWLRGFSDAINALDNPDMYGERWWERFVGTAVPTGVAQIERAISPEMSAVNSWLDQIKSRTPGLSDELPPRRNVWSEIITLGGGLGPDIASPVYTSKEKPSPIDDELIRLDIPAGMPRKEMSIMGIPIELNPSEYDDFIVAMNSIKLDSTGKTLKKSLNFLVRQNTYKILPDEQKINYIRRHFTEAKMRAKEHLYEKNPELRAIIDHAIANQGM